MNQVHHYSILVMPTVQALSRRYILAILSNNDRGAAADAGTQNKAWLAKPQKIIREAMASINRDNFTKKYSML